MNTVENQQLVAACKELSYYKVRLIYGITRKRYLALRENKPFIDRRGRPANPQVEKAVLNYVRKCPRQGYRRLAHQLGFPSSTVQYIFIKYQLRTASEREQFAQAPKTTLRILHSKKPDIE
ncbi:MAG: hypothetical protein N2246_09605 [Candidatus Sumerlaeia bacterium]|nr:hypothetical protein [Candidatus Sumerlaeia bacterium]